MMVQIFLLLVYMPPIVFSSTKIENTKSETFYNEEGDINRLFRYKMVTTPVSVL